MASSEKSSDTKSRLQNHRVTRSAIYGARNHEVSELRLAQTDEENPDFYEDLERAQDDALVNESITEYMHRSRSRPQGDGFGQPAAPRSGGRWRS